MKKLKDIIKEFKMAGESDEIKKLPIAEKKRVLAMIGEYNKLGKVLNRDGSLTETAKQLGEIAEAATHITLSEAGEDWMDKKTINENMKSLTNFSKEFGKLAQEAHSTEQRMTALYEDMGHILGRYFEIKEPIDEVNSLNDF